MRDEEDFTIHYTCTECGDEHVDNTDSGMTPTCCGERMKSEDDLHEVYVAALEVKSDE